MAKAIRPKWYPHRRCFRARKTIAGKTLTFYGGHGASGTDDVSAMARAQVEIETAVKDHLLGKRAELVGAMSKGQRKLRAIDDAATLVNASADAEIGYWQNIDDPESIETPPLLAELRSLRE